MSDLEQVRHVMEASAPDPLPFAADGEVQEEATGPWILEEQNKHERDKEEGPTTTTTVHDVKRALRQNFHDTGAIDDVTVGVQRKDACRPAAGWYQVG